MTPAQLATLKADILADNTLAAKPLTSAGALEIATAYAVVGAVDVWRTEAKVADVLDAINFAAYTPNDAALDNDTAAVAAAKTNRLLAIQTKQINLQMMTQGRDTLNASKANIRGSLRDAVINLPSGAGGSSIQAGGANGATVLAACVRKANRFEALFATGPVSTGGTSAKLLALEGNVSSDDVQAARELP